MPEGTRGCERSRNGVIQILPKPCTVSTYKIVVLRFNLERILPNTVPDKAIETHNLPGGFCDFETGIARKNLLTWAASSISRLASAVALPPLVVDSIGGAVALGQVFVTPLIYRTMRSKRVQTIDQDHQGGIGSARGSSTKDANTGHQASKCMDNLHVFQEGTSFVQKDAVCFNVAERARLRGQVFASCSVPIPRRGRRSFSTSVMPRSYLTHPSPTAHAQKLDVGNSSHVCTTYPIRNKWIRRKDQCRLRHRAQDLPSCRCNHRCSRHTSRLADAKVGGDQPRTTRNGCKRLGQNENNG